MNTLEQKHPKTKFERKHISPYFCVTDIKKTYNKKTNAAQTINVIVWHSLILTLFFLNKANIKSMFQLKHISFIVSYF
jgi:hypothetical protein